MFSHVWDDHLCFKIILSQSRASKNRDRDGNVTAEGLVDQRREQTPIWRCFTPTADFNSRVWPLHDTLCRLYDDRWVCCVSVSINLSHKNESGEEEGQKVDSVVSLEKVKSLQSYIFIRSY